MLSLLKVSYCDMIWENSVGMHFNWPLTDCAVKSSAAQIVQRGFVTVFSQALLLSPFSVPTLSAFVLLMEL